jgi:hypothetical protein
VLTTRNDAAWWVALGALAALAVALYWVPLMQVFSFAPLAPASLVPVALAALAALLWFGALKTLHRRSLGHRAA